jgi:DNA-binding MarR family transcriptional regulator
MDNKIKTSKRPGFLLWQAANHWQKEQKKSLSSLNLTHVQFILLHSVFLLEKEIEFVSQALVAKKANTDPMMTSQVSRVLVKKGYLSRQGSCSDSRAFSLQTTHKGRVLVIEAIKVIEEVDKKFFAKVDISTFAKNLENLVEG